MPAFSLTPVNAFPQTDGTEFPQPLQFAHNGTLFPGPITLVNFVGGTVTEDGNGGLDVTLGGGGATVPGSPTGSFQWNDAGAFGGTFGLGWTPELLSEALITFQNFSVNNRALNMTPSSTTWFTIGEADLTANWAAVGSRTYSTVTYPPVSFQLTRAGLWVGGPLDTTSGPTTAYDGWFLSNAMVFQLRSDPTQYTHFKPLALKGSPVTPTGFDTAFEVTINGSNYWVPCVLQ